MAVNGKRTRETRFYTLSNNLTARAFREAVRSHWSIESRCHWQLDVMFQEDQRRIRKGHAATNFSRLRRTPLNLLRNNDRRRVGIKRLIEGYLTKVLRGK